jgi:murein DD-endopeptidase MepM/ murein hydrolase activator NlpD
MVAAMTRLVIAATLAAGALLVAPSSALGAWTWPLNGEVVTAYRNGDDPYAAGQHRGIDIEGRVGAPVVAAASGLVRFAGTAGSSGSTVSVRSEDGRFDVSYLHLGSIAVRPGARVASGEAIGTVGTTGIRSLERPHLHFGVRAAASRHAYVDPLTLLPPVAAPPPRPPQAVPVAAPAPTRPAPAPAPVPTPRAAPVRAPSPAARPLPAPAPALGPVPIGGPAVAGHAIRGPRTVHPERVPEGRGSHAARPGPSHGGTDIGWAAACAGMLAAALALSIGRVDRLADAAAAPRARLAALLGYSDSPAASRASARVP